MLLDRVPEPPMVRDLDVGSLRLHGLDSRLVGNVAEIELHWQVVSKPTTPLRRTMVVTDARGNVAAAAPGSILDDLFPAQQWTAGQIVVERVRLETGGVFPDRARIGWQRPDGSQDSIEISLELTR